MNLRNGFQRILSGKDAYFLIVGNILGIGIFTTSGYVANYTASAGMLLLLWLVGGVLAFCGAMTYAELGARFPLAGGDYHYLAHAYHPAVGYLFGWSAFTVTYTGSIATLSVGFAHYFLNFLPAGIREAAVPVPFAGFSVSTLKLVAMAVVLVITALNVRGLRSGSRWQAFFTLSGIAALVLFAALGFSASDGSWNHLTPFWSGSPSLANLSGLGIALIGVYFTYSGWTAIVYIAGEVKEPSRTLPKSLAYGILTVSFLYLLINLVYLFAFPVAEMRNVVDIGYRALLRLRGESWSLMFSLIILVVVLSTLNATILSGARIYYAMSREGQFFPFAGKLHPRRRVPVSALWLQAGWTLLLILSGSFNQLLTYTVFVMVGFALLSGISLFVLRQKQPLSGDRFWAWGYPVTPAVYVALTGWIALNTLLNHPVQAVLGIAAVMLGWPFYFWFQWRSGRRTD